MRSNENPRPAARLRVANVTTRIPAGGEAGSPFMASASRVRPGRAAGRSRACRLDPYGRVGGTRDER